MTFPHPYRWWTRHVLNPRALRTAGRGGSLADLEHVGRRSGQIRHTPVRAFRTEDTVVIGVNFGRESDWVKNIVAAGRCRMRLHGQQLELTAPMLVPVRDGVRGMPWWFGVGLRYIVRTRECLRLTITAEASSG